VSVTSAGTATANRRAPVGGGEPEQRPLSLLVVDDRDVVLCGLIEVLRTWPGELRQVSARGGEDVCRRARALRPDVALVRDTLAAPRGQNLTSSIARCSPSTSIVLLTDGPGPSHSPATPSCYPTISLESSGGELIDAVLAYAGRMTQPRHDHALSHRERLVLGGLAMGETNLEIARRLCLSRGTVKQHAAAIYRRLGVRNRAGAVAEAGRRGWLE